MKSKIAIVGASEHGKVVADIINKTNTYSIAGFIDAQKTKSVDLWGYKILGSEDDIGLVAQEYDIEYAVIAIGDNHTRDIVKEKIMKSWPKVKFASCIHPSVILGHKVKIGNGTVIMAGVIVNPNTTIGDHCIINTKTSVDHDNTIGNFVSLAPNVTTGGNVTIGDFSAIGLSASIIHGKTIGQHSIIGASSLVVNNFSDQIVAYGVPAKLMRTREKGERYL